MAQGYRKDDEVGGEEKEFVCGVQVGSGGNRQTERRIERMGGIKKKIGKDDGIGMSRGRERCKR